MELKIGRNEYEITCSDIFMDNGACVQLMTQSKERSQWRGSPSPVLSQKAIKQINKYDHLPQKNNYGIHVKTFSLKI